MPGEEEYVVDMVPCNPTSDIVDMNIAVKGPVVLDVPVIVEYAKYLLAEDTLLKDRNPDGPKLPTDFFIEAIDSSIKEVTVVNFCVDNTDLNVLDESKDPNPPEVLNGKDIKWEDGVGVIKEVRP